MLRIKYFEKFKEGNPSLLIIAAQEGYAQARDFFAHQKEGFLNDKAVTEFFDVFPLSENSLYLTSSECEKISNIFGVLANNTQPTHMYFDTEALDEIEMIISIGEYDGLF